MNTIKQSHLILERGEVVKLEAGSGTLTLNCSLGSAWITASLDRNDYVLRSGEAMEVPAGRAVVIEGLLGRLEIDVKRCA